MTVTPTAPADVKPGDIIQTVSNRYTVTCIERDANGYVFRGDDSPPIARRGGPDASYGIDHPVDIFTPDPEPAFRPGDRVMSPTGKYKGTVDGYYTTGLVRVMLDGFGISSVYPEYLIKPLPPEEDTVQLTVLRSTADIYSSGLSTIHSSSERNTAFNDVIRAAVKATGR
jgi:hypothetical protein